MRLYMQCGYSPYYIYIIFKKYAKEITEISSNPIISGIGGYVKNKKVSLKGLKTGESIEEAYNHLASRKGIKIMSDITKMPLVIPAVDIKTSKEYIFTNNVLYEEKEKYISEITIGKAVRASSSFPAVFCPCEYKNHMFLDGGTLDNIPIIPLENICDKKILAVNFEADKVEVTSDVMDIIMKTLDVMGNKIAEKGLEQSDFILTVPTDRAGLFDIEKLDKCYKFGYDSTIKNIEKIKNIMNDN